MCKCHYLRYICTAYDDDEWPIGHVSGLHNTLCPSYNAATGECLKGWENCPSPSWDKTPDKYCPNCRKLRARLKRDNARAADDRKE